MAYTRTEWRTGETPLSAANMNNIEDGIAELRTLIETSFDMWHPIGGYFETSDTTFDPNTAEGWNGTWVLENPGVVHVSAGTGYTAGTSGGSANVSYTPAGTVANHTLTSAQSGNQAQSVSTTSAGGHTHTVSGTTASAGAHTHTIGQKDATMAHGGGVPYLRPSGTSISTASAGTHTHSFSGTTSNAGSHSHTVSIAAKNATQGHNHGFTGTAASISVMQPYVVVNRWHRTA